MRRFFLSCIFGLCSFLVYAQNNVPQVIPALQEWTSRKGKYVLPPEGSIFVSRGDSCTLAGIAATLADDMMKMFGYEYEVMISCRAGNAEIKLSLSGSDEAGTDEGYELSVGKGIAIRSVSPAGVFWGTRTLLQFICNQPDGMLKGKAVDYPQYPSRGFMLDAGRKFFPIDFLKDYIRILSFYKMNEFQLHLNDNGFVEFAGNDWNSAYSAFRLESERYPGLAARDGHYSKDEFRELQEFAESYGVRIIPEIDIPAHSLAFTHYNPNLAADNPEYGFDHLDLYKPEVYDFLDNLFDEYLSGENPVFAGDEVHIGTDEYNRKEADQFRKFTNHYISLIKGYGKKPRIWGSLKVMDGDVPVNLDGTVVSAWNYGWMDLQTALDSGAEVVNMCDYFLYIVPAVNYYHDFLDLEWLYNDWTPELMNDVRVEKHPNLLGAMFAVWNDRVGNGITQQDVHFRCFPAVQLISDKLWKGENRKNVPYEDFRRLCQKMPEAPGVNIAATVDREHMLLEEGMVLELGGGDVVETALSEIGYPYFVEFDIMADEEPAIDAVLFKGPHSEFIANWQNTGKFAFRREGLEFVFHKFSLPSGEWKKIRIEGDWKGTSIYVDGVFVERLEGRVREVYNSKSNRKDRIWYQETLIFPLGQIGDKYMGFKGKVRNVKCGPMDSE